MAHSSTPLHAPFPPLGNTVYTKTLLPAIPDVAVKGYSDIILKKLLIAARIKIISGAVFNQTAKSTNGLFFAFTLKAQVIYYL